MVLVASVPDGAIKYLVNVADWYAEEAWRPDPCLIRVLCVLVHIREPRVFWHHITILVAIQLESDKGARLQLVSGAPPIRQRRPIT